MDRDDSLNDPTDEVTDAASTPTVMAILRMGSGNAIAHLTPLARAIAPATLHVVRPEPRPVHLIEPNVVYSDTSSSWVLLALVRTIFKGLIITWRQDVRVIVSFNAYPYGVLAAFIGLLSGRPFHVGFVGSDLRLAEARPWWLRVLRRAALTTTPGFGSARTLARLDFTEPLIKLEHGVDEARFFGDPLDERPIDCLYVGALIERKRVDQVLHALAILGGSVPVRMVIVGDGPLRPQLELLARELGIDHAVEFVGAQDRPEEWMRQAKILVLVSQWEGLPFALIEAMRCGTVPVVTPVGSIRDLVVDRENGRLTEASPEGIAAALQDILSDDQKRASIAQRAKLAVWDLTYEGVAAQWRDLLQLLVAYEVNRA